MITAFNDTKGAWIAGVDGCPVGWVVAFAPVDDISHPVVRVVRSFAEIVHSVEKPAVIAVDTPIGLPDRIEGPGRAAERLVRPLLGKRQSSVFSIPSRRSVYAADYPAACAEAAATSDPPRKVSKQGFMIFPKIREVDLFLCSEPTWIDAVFESHPEVAFRAMNGGVALLEPKKVKGKPWGDGMDLRRRLLGASGIGTEALAMRAPKGAATDDLLDALACLVTAQAIARGDAQSFPASPERDAHNIPIAIWAPLTQKRATQEA